MRIDFKLMLPILLCMGALSASGNNGQEPIDSVINRGLRVSTQQALAMAKELAHKAGALPTTYENGELRTSSYRAWTSGFFPGVLWYVYENARTEELKQYAEMYTARVEGAKNITSNHDVGFMLNCSFGNGYRLTGNPAYQAVMKKGAESLATRYNDKIAAIKSWNSTRSWQYPVIIDNMMNLEFLMVVAKETGDKRYAEIANNHARTTLDNHFRKDFSSYHVVSFDTLTGKPHIKQTHQGYADESAWARGQAWGLYGFTMMYRETGKAEYLKQACGIASFLMNHPNMPADKVPYWDFNAPDIPNAVRDASSAAIMASALIELSQLDKSPRAPSYLDYAKEQIRSLSSPAYLAKPGSNGCFILMHSTGHFNRKTEVDVPLSYADYYYVEALTRLKHLLCKNDDRAYWVATLTKIAEPVLMNISNNTLKKNMPYETLSDMSRRNVSYLEAFGRTMCGIAPWLELGADDTAEGKLRARFIEMAVKGIGNAVNPQAPDYLVFDGSHGPQALVDAAFLAQALLRAPKQLWGNLSKESKAMLVTELKRSRSIRAYNNNWLLFASIIETALLEYAGEYDSDRLYKGVDRFIDEWYKGDGWYGDGSMLHIDYYNSFVIHPMLTDVLLVLKKHGMKGGEHADVQLKRMQRYAAVQERFISPEGTYPAVGRSIVYRFGAFHALAQASLMGILPKKVAPAQVRCALTAVMKRQINAPRTFDANGWLRVGFAGSQLHMSETYINTGSLYLCTAVFLPLGLPADNEFWSSPYTEWTNLKAWSGVDVGADKALQE